MSNPKRKGICRLSVIPVKAEASDKSEMVTQLLFGDHYEVLEESHDHHWLKIKICFDGYKGWISSQQSVDISEIFYRELNQGDHKIATDLTAPLTFQGKTVHVVMGSILPFSSRERSDVETQSVFKGAMGSAGGGSGYDCLQKTAFKYLNVPYLWGGKTPFGIDCSGFTQQVFRICGYNLMRDSWQQAGQGLAVDGLAEASPGDLAFFAKNDKRIYHVGIILPENRVIHASGYVRIDRLDKEGIFNENLNRYTHKLFTIRRILKNEV